MAESVSKTGNPRFTSQKTELSQVSPKAKAGTDTTKGKAQTSTRGAKNEVSLFTDVLEPHLPLDPLTLTTTLLGTGIAGVLLYKLSVASKMAAPALFNVEKNAAAWVESLSGKASKPESSLTKLSSKDALFIPAIVGPIALGASLVYRNAGGSAPLTHSQAPSPDHPAGAQGITASTETDQTEEDKDSENSTEETASELAEDSTEAKQHQTDEPAGSQTTSKSKNEATDKAQIAKLNKIVRAYISFYPHSPFAKWADIYGLWKQHKPTGQSKLVLQRLLDKKIEKPADLRRYSGLALRELLAELSKGLTPNPPPPLTKKYVEHLAALAGQTLDEFKESFERQFNMPLSFQHDSKVIAGQNGNRFKIGHKQTKALVEFLQKRKPTQVTGLQFYKLLAKKGWSDEEENLLRFSELQDFLPWIAYASLLGNAPVPPGLEGILSKNKGEGQALTHASQFWDDSSVKPKISLPDPEPEKSGSVPELLALLEPGLTARPIDSEHLKQELDNLKELKFDEVKRLFGLTDKTDEQAHETIKSWMNPANRTPTINAILSYLTSMSLGEAKKMFGPYLGKTSAEGLSKEIAGLMTHDTSPISPYGLTKKSRDAGTIYNILNRYGATKRHDTVLMAGILLVWAKKMQSP